VVDAAEAKVVQAGILRAIGTSGEPEAVNVFTADGKRLGHYGGEIELLPGAYRIGINQSTSEAIEIEGGRTVDYQFGAIEMGETCEIHEAGGKRLGWYGGTILLVPGSYRVTCSGAKASSDVSIEAGEVVRVD
jgi:hypothetical protein